MKRSPLTRKTPLAQGDGLERRRQPRARNHADNERWYAAGGDHCEHPECPGQEGRLVLHHVTFRQELERVGGDLWDPRNALTLCDGCHTSHHGRSRVVPLHALPDSAFAFAAETLGAGRAYEYLRRRYDGSDVRLERLLQRCTGERYVPERRAA